MQSSTMFLKNNRNERKDKMLPLNKGLVFYTGVQPKVNALM